MQKSRIIRLIIRRLRVLMIFSGFIFMYMLYINKFDSILFLIAFGFSMIELSAGFYNDYCDYEEDKKAERYDKWTITGIATPETMRNISFLILIIALAILSFTDSIILLIAFYYSALAIAYSHPKIRLKRYDIKAYMWGGSIWILILFYLGSIFQRNIFSDISLILFCFFQSVYLVCQKDSSDIKDETNLFLSYKWGKASFISTIFAISSSICLFLVLLPYPNLFWLWWLNALSKFSALYKIYKRKMTRDFRMKTSSIELITPYLFVFFF